MARASREYRTLRYGHSPHLGLALTHIIPRYAGQIAAWPLARCGSPSAAIG